MTKKLFWEDPYLTTLDTRIEFVSGSLVGLRETIFFAQSGGQESDTGTIAGFPVLEAQKSGPDILYQLSEQHGLNPGDRVRVEIDWTRRYRLMRLHFAAELILELVYRELKDIEKIGAHIAVDKARIDFFWAESLAPRLPEFATQAQSLIDRDLVIVSAYSDAGNERRYWEIPGFARVPCGGTHLKHTSEVGLVSLKRKNIGRWKERIEVYAEERS